MTRNLKNGTWIPCDPEIRKFIRSGGPNTYVTPEGVTVRGENARYGRGGEFGYRKHREGKQDGKGAVCDTQP